MTPLEYCQHTVQRSGSSFLASFYFLPTAQRHAITVLYAYCRELDDTVDTDNDVGVAQQHLQWRHMDLHKIFENQMPEHPIHQALREIIPIYRLPEDELSAIICGMEMDLLSSRYTTFDDLRVYCYRAAGVVGRLVARILGFENAQTLAYAEQLGLALQLTNIIRDVGEDARKGRIYLPMQELQQFQVPAHDILHANITPAFTALMQFQCQRARQTYRDALQLLPKSDRTRQRAGVIMAAIYHALLVEIERDGAQNVLKYKIRIPNPRKIRIAIKTRLFGFRP